MDRRVVGQETLWIRSSEPWSTEAMSLSVDVFLVGDDGKDDLQEVPAGSSDLAGFERWRTVVWGSEATRALGAKFFPVLAEDDWLRVEPAQVADFQAECVLLRSNLEVVAPSADPFKSHAEFVEQISD